jgi:BlaI family penicillinase repressor
MRKPGSARSIPPPLELLCLKALWTVGEGKVEDVRRIVSQTRPLAYTTVMTVLERLSRRNAVSRRKVGRSFLYVPQVSREALRKLAVQDLLDTFFDGSEEQLAAYLRNQSLAGTSSMEARQPVIESGLDTALL